MTETRLLQLDQIHAQLEDWQENLARRVAGEAQALDVEVEKLHDRELEEAQQGLRGARTQILAGCDTIRDFRRRLQDRQPTTQQSAPRAVLRQRHDPLKQNRGRRPALTWTAARPPPPEEESSRSGEPGR